MDNTLTIWTEQKAHIKIEDDNDTYTAEGILLPDCFEMSLSGITSDNQHEITDEILDRIKLLIEESNKENTFQIKISD